MIGSPTRALLWEIWQRRRATAIAVIGVTMAGRLLDSVEQARVAPGGEGDASALVGLSWMAAFALLFGIFTYTDSGGSRGIGGFPRRLFTLPVSSLQLVAMPTLTGVAAVELLYLAWLAPLSRGSSTSPLYVAVLLAALMVFYQGVLWVLERLAPLRLVIAGAIALVMLVIGLLPTFPPQPPPWWRSELGLGAMTGGAAVLVFLLTWRRVASLRCGGTVRARRLRGLVTSVTMAMPARRRPFRSAAAAQFWFDWRTSGLVLPLLLAGALLIIVAPYSWLLRDDAARTWQLVLGTLALPLILAIPVGMAFSRPTFWSDDLSMPAFVAVRPLAAEDLVAIKVRVAAASAAISWVLVISFLVLWLSVWGSVEAVSLFAIQLWAFHGHSVPAVAGIAALVAICGAVLTWRCLISRLWSGLSGNRPLFTASIASVFVIGVGGMIVDASRLPGWVVADPARTAVAAWAASGMVILKCWAAAWTWRRVSPGYVRQYLAVWFVGETCLVALVLVFWNVIRIYAALDVLLFQALLVCVALLALPLARVGLAPASLARNRHR